MLTFEAVGVWLWPHVDDRREWAARNLWTLRGRDAAMAVCTWRWVAFGWMFGIQCWSWSLEQDGGYALAYLTNDSMWLNIFYFALSSSLSTVALVRDARGATYKTGMPPAADAPSALHQRIWLHTKRLSVTLLGIAVAWETVVVILYWALLYGGGGDSTFFMDNVNIHGTVALFPWVDIFIGTHLLPDNTVVVVLAAAIVYLCMNAGVSKTVSVIYSVLAWDRGSDAILVIGALLGVTIFYFAGAAAAARCACCRQRHSVDGGAHNEPGADVETSLVARQPGKAATVPWFPLPPTEFADTADESALIPCGACCSRRCTARSPQVVASIPLPGAP